MYEANLLRKTEAQPIPNNGNGTLKNAAIAVLLKYLNNFYISLEMPLINCKVELKLKWTEYCDLSAAGNEDYNDKDNEGNNKSNNIIFTIKDKKMHVTVVTLSARDNQKLSKLLSKGSERSVYWNKYLK